MRDPDTWVAKRFFTTRSGVLCHVLTPAAKRILETRLWVLTSLRHALRSALLLSAKRILESPLGVLVLFHVDPSRMGLLLFLLLLHVDDVPQARPRLLG